MPHLQLAALVCLAALAATAEDINIKAQLRFPASGQEKVFALTIDDGPRPDGAPVLMAAMAKVGWKATFCVIGRFVDEQPAIAKRMIAEGHEVANHTYSHSYFNKMTIEQIDEDVAKGHAAILKATGVAPIFLRAPGINITAEQMDHLHEKFGYRFLATSFDSRDWAKEPAGVVTKRLLDGKLQNGDIVLAHEVFPQSLKELPDIIATLAAQGWRSVTVSQLIKLKAKAAVH